MPKKKNVVEGRNQRERIKIRKNLGSLRSLTVQPSTRKRYDLALDLFFQWLKEEGLSLPRQKGQVDSLVSEHLEKLWSTGEGRSRANDTLAALQDFDPQLKHRLQLSWRLLKAWSTTEIPNRAPPLPVEALHAMVGYSICQGSPDFGLSLLIAFFGLLRTGEILALTNGDITMASSWQPAVLALGLTKGGKRTGASESVTLSAVEVLRPLYQWKVTHKRSSRLTQAPHLWRKQFSDTIEALGWSEFHFRPYSLRRGGATFWFGRHANFDRLLQLGRWQAIKSARVYLNDGLAMMASLNLPWKKAKPFLKTYQTTVRNFQTTA